MQWAVFLIISGSTSLAIGLVLPQDAKDRKVKRNADDPETEKHIFQMPTGLDLGYEINVTGILTQESIIIFSLITRDKNDKTPKPDWNNVACEVQFNFATDDSIMVGNVTDGIETFKNEELSARSMLNDNFTVAFVIKHEKNIEVKFGNSVSQEGCYLVHDLAEISYLVIKGRIEKLKEFNFKLR